MPTSVRNALTFTTALASNPSTGAEPANYALRDGLKYLTPLATRASDGTAVAGDLVSVRYGLRFSEPLARVLGVVDLTGTAQLDTAALDQTPSAIGAALISLAQLGTAGLTQTQTIGAQALTAGASLPGVSLQEQNVLGLGDGTTLALGDGSSLSLE